MANRPAGNAEVSPVAAELSSTRHATDAGAVRIAAVPEWMAAQFPQFADLRPSAGEEMRNLLTLPRFGSGAGDRTEALARDLDELRETVKEGGSIEKYALSSAVAVSTGLSVGYAAWLVRGGVLLSTLLSSMPAWRVLDPFPVLARQRDPDEDDDGDDDSLESMVGEGDGAEEPIVSDETRGHRGSGGHSDHGAGGTPPRS